MPSYKVTYEIEVDAASPRAAAELVWKWLSDGNHEDPVLTVTSRDGEQSTIDLAEAAE